MKLQPELKTAKWIFDCSYLLASFAESTEQEKSTAKAAFYFRCTENGILKSLMPAVVAV